MGTVVCAYAQEYKNMFFYSTINLLLFLVNILVICGEENVKVMSNKEAYDDLKRRLSSIKKSCGEVCDQTIEGKPGKYFDEITKDIDCPALFSNPDMDIPSQFKDPPIKIPKWLLDDYSYHGKVEINNGEYYYDNTVSKNHHNFTKVVIDICNDQMDRDVFEGPYGKYDADKINRFIKDYMNVKDQHVLVIGSETPWIEVMALRNGARHVTTVDYVKMISEDPRLSILHANDFNSMFLNNELKELDGGPIDAIISYSSIEHSGLGRYGDSLNPWGDLIAMARAWCVLKPGGKALIGFPMGPGKDQILFNGNKNYGPVMLPHIFANWKQIHSELDYKKFYPPCPWCYQELFLVEK